ncbi:MAG: mechanosensitive ion channel family protein, partial [Candidatus Pacebacteria bacterium]|nr:mechanosensitive ion channel family protein [Candidatus Paceibacterota bacterium]
SLFISSKFLDLSVSVNNAINYFALIAFIIFVATFLQKLVNYLSFKKFIEHKENGRETDASIVKILANIINWGVWILAILLILQNSGIDIGALLAGAGIIGIAIAFALKEVLADLFACFSIYFDKPFEVGDYVVLEGNRNGTIKKIGLRTTRIETLRGEELVVSNRKLTESFLRNYKKMKKRRVNIEVSIDPKTSLKNLEKGKEIIKKIIEKQEETEVKWVIVLPFNGNSWTYDIVYSMNTKSYSKYMTVREDIVLSIRKAFEKEKIKFALNSQKIILKKD